MIERYANETAEFIKKAQSTEQRDFWIAQAARTLKSHTKMNFRKAREYVWEILDYEPKDLYFRICCDFVWDKHEQIKRLKENHDMLLAEAAEVRIRIDELERELLEENIR